MADRRLPTRALLICGAFAAIQAGLFAAVVPVTTVLAASAPPAYALVAALHTVMPFLARLITGLPGTALVTSAVTGLLVSAISPIGPLSAVPLIIAGAVFDACLLPGRSSARITRVVIAAAAVGAALFAVSLPVFSSEHLVAPVLVATVIGRVVGEIGAAVLAVATTRMLRRAGVRTGRVR